MERWESGVVRFFFFVIAQVGERLKLRCVGWRARGEKPGIPRLIVVIGFGLGILLALDFNADELLCVFSWVHNEHL